MSVWGGKRRRSRVRRSGWVVFLAVGSLFASAGTAGADAVQASAHRRASAPHVHAAPTVKGVKPVAMHFAKPHDQATRRYRPTATSLPKPQTATLPVAAAHTSLAAGHASSRLPLSMEQVAPKHGSYSGPSAVSVAVKPRAQAAKAGVNGVLFTLTPSGKHSGAVRLSLDYSGFAQAYGGGFGSRLHLVRLPVCALTSPQRPACRTQTPMRSKNDARSKSLSTTLQLGSATGGTPAGAQKTATTGSPMMVMAAVSGSGGGDGGGPSGSYAATTLKPSGSWSAGGSSGSFTYSYPMAVPPAASSLTPDVSLGYDSGSVDGQTAATQAQSSWVGDGWNTPQSFIEQSFTSCSDSPEGTASPVSTSDECYDGPILTLSLDGSTTSLVWDSSKNVWKPQNDNGAVVKHVTNSGNGTGTYNTDYWTVTERDGKVYSFGRNHLPGWASGKPVTNSVDSIPVYSAHSGDPCYSSSGFTSSVCTMAYRWNLDYVTDVQGDAMSYYYKQDTNYYGEDNGAHNVSYVRDSHL
ncbi:hypothetical protein ABZ623_40920, partial [Streptomyces sp. NPDC007206]